jgi:hypothetical protein
MAIAQRSLFPKQMDRDIIDMYMDRLAKYPSEYEGVAKQENFPKGREYRAAEISGLGSVEVIGEGGRPAFDTPVEGHEKAVEAVKYGLGYMITEEMMDDDYHGKIKGVAGTLADSAKDMVNVRFFSLFNDGNDTHTSWDGSYVFAAHTTMKSGGTLTNIGTSALAETTFQAAFEYYDKLTDEAGRKISVKGDRLLVPTELRWMANRLANQRGGISTSGTAPNLGLNDMTTNPSNGYVDPWQVVVCRYLTASTAWFFISSKDHDARLLWKKKITLQSSDDWQTDSRLYKVTFRVVPAVFDYKGMYGAFV